MMAYLRLKWLRTPYRASERQVANVKYYLIDPLCMGYKGSKIELTQEQCITCQKVNRSQAAIESQGC